MNSLGKVLTVANQKGGVGKTATLVYVAWHCEKSIENMKVCFVDLDTQGNASYTLSERKSSLVASDLFFKSDLDVSVLSRHESISLIAADRLMSDVQNMPLNEAATNFTNNIKNIAKHVDLVLIDTPPSLGNTLLSALAASDFVYVPMELEMYSLKGYSKMKSTIEEVKKIANPNLTSLGILPSKVDTRKARQKKHLTELKENLGNEVLPCYVGLRDSIAESLTTKSAVWNVKRSGAARVAAKEMKQAVSVILNKMEMEKA